MFVYILWLPELILYDQDPPHRTASSAKTRVRMKKLVKIHHKYSYLGSVPKNMIFTKPHFKPLKLFLFLHHSSSSSGVLYIAAAKNFRLAFVRRSRHLETKVEKSSRYRHRKRFFPLTHTGEELGADWTGGKFS